MGNIPQGMNTQTGRFKLHVRPQDYPEVENHLARETGKSPKPILFILLSSSGKHSYSQPVLPAV